MKNIILAFGFLAASISCVAAQSSMNNFFRDEGVKALAFLAHPTNDFDRGTYAVYTDKVIVEIFYSEGYYTNLELRRNGDFFTGIRVLRDTDFIAPFSAVWAIKELLHDFISSPDEEEMEVVGQFERMFQSTVANMTGRDIACLITTLAWFAY